MMFRCWCAASLLALLSVSPALDEPLIRPGDRYTVLTTPHLSAYVPEIAAERLKPLIARADAIYAVLAKDAGYHIKDRLRLWVSDDRDDHNGFSSVIPFPLVAIQLAPALPRSAIFTGDRVFERTLVHELAHHISNDRNHGLRAAIAGIFGRVLPSDVLSLIVFYLSTPAHVTMPSFWQEGFAQWAETTYAPAGTAWRGRGADSLTHLVWRLDAASGTIPPSSEWSLLYQRWPYGNRAYLYGLAYVRWLASAHARRSPWQLIDSQARQWAFRWNGGVRDQLGLTHAQLIAAARQALLDEQQAILTTLRSRPVTMVERLTPRGSRVGAPAWLDAGRLAVALDEPTSSGRIQVIDRSGVALDSFADAWTAPDLRSDPQGLLWADVDDRLDPHAPSRLRSTGPDAPQGTRLLMPSRAGGAVVAVRLETGGGQSLVRIADGRQDVLPTSGLPWSPVLSPDGRMLAWVETDAAGSRLVMADGGGRRVLWSVAARILHPCWSGDLRFIYACSDVSGVPNAYRIAVADGTAQAITNTIGGIIAAVPSPDGTQLAVVEHDIDGPFIGIIANEEAQYVGVAPVIALAFPAPVGGAAAPAARPLGALVEPVVTSAPYSGLAELRPWFWTPTTFAVPEGGLGVVTFASDPLSTHEAVASIGIGGVAGTGVGLLGYANATYPLQGEVVAWRAERAYDRQVQDLAGDQFYYAERVDTAQIRLGRGLAGSQRQLQAFADLQLRWQEDLPIASRQYENRVLTSTTPFVGRAASVGVTVGWSDHLLFPTSYAKEQGESAVVELRRGIDGWEFTRITALASYVQSVWPSAGHQLVFGGAIGWSTGTRHLQGQFQIGGDASGGLPRGYASTAAVGEQLLAASLAYRLPLWRPFAHDGSSSFGFRQVVLEGFYDGAIVSRGRMQTRGAWYRSTGAELRGEFSVLALRSAPGLGVARQVDGNEEITAYFTIGFAW